MTHFPTIDLADLVTIQGGTSRSTLAQTQLTQLADTLKTATTQQQSRSSVTTTMLLGLMLARR